MAASKRLKECILEHQKLLSDLREKRDDLEDAQAALTLTRRKLISKEEELLKEVQSCFTPDGTRHRIVHAGAKVFMVDMTIREIRGEDTLLITEVQMER